MKSGVKNFLVRLPGTIVGLTLLISGILKLADPVGTGLIIDSYWEFFGMSFLITPLSKAFGFALSLFETGLGAMLITGVFRRFSSWAATILIGFFTLITLILLIFNPEMDCGCFGKAISLTHTQSFVKNLILLALTAGAVMPSKGGYRFVKKRRYPAFGLLSAGILFGAIYSLVTIPVKDFTPFRPGVEIVGDISSDTAGDNGHELTYIYEKDGVRGEFSISDIPDSTWTYIGTGAKSEAPLKADDSFVPLPVFNESGESCESLVAKGDVIIFSVYDPSGHSDRFWARTAGRMEDAAAAGFTPVLLIACSPSDIRADLEKAGIESALVSDRKTLLSLNRADGGATWMHNGMLVRKWAKVQFPSREGLRSLLAEDPVKEMLDTETSSRVKFDGFILYCLAVILLA